MAVPTPVPIPSQKPILRPDRMRSILAQESASKPTPNRHPGPHGLERSENRESARARLPAVVDRHDVTIGIFERERRAEGARPEILDDRDSSSLQFLVQGGRIRSAQPEDDSLPGVLDLSTLR